MHITELNIRRPKFNSYVIEQNDLNNNKEVLRFDRINILIGENNSGKSRFLRTVFTDFDYSSFRDGENWNNSIRSKLIHIDEMLFSLKFRKNNSDVSLSALLNNPISRIDTYSNRNISSVAELKSITATLESTSKSVLANMNYQLLDENAFVYANKCLEEIDNTVKDINNIFNKSNVSARYIPVLRGLKPLNRGSLNEWNYENLYKDRIIYEYYPFIEKSHMLYDCIFTGQNLYELVKLRLLGTQEDRNFINNYENYLSENLFDEKQVSIIPNDESKTLFVKIGTDIERPIHDFGDGIQSIIILTFELFANRGKNMLFFIEEPEIYLHPKYQRRLVETFLKEEFNTFQYFINTHSNHFIDLVNDYSNISIFAFSPIERESKLKQFSIEKVSDDSYKPYELLGVRNSSLLLSNCTIWVEGLSDKIYISKYLDIYQKNVFGKIKYKEDIHYSFIEYGGNNLLHWNFINDDEVNLNFNAISKKVFLILDKDDPKPNSKKDKRQKEFVNKYGNNCFVLKCKEIENTRSLKVLKNTIAKFPGKNQVIPELVTSVVSEKEYMNIGLGSFIDKNLKLGNKKFSSESGTLNRKIDFAKAAIEFMADISDLSTEAKRICKEMIRFIQENN